MASSLKKRTRCVWTKFEEDHLYEGVIKHGEGNWNSINSIPELTHKTLPQLKDKWKNLKKNKTAHEDKMKKMRKLYNVSEEQNDDEEDIEEEVDEGHASDVVESLPSKENSADEREKENDISSPTSSTNGKTNENEKKNQTSDSDSSV